jgi:hypothetical protein
VHTTHHQNASPVGSPLCSNGYGYALEDYPLLLGSDLGAVARALPNLAELEICGARLSGGVPAPLAALTRLRLVFCSCPEGAAPLRLGGAAVPGLRSLETEASDARCVALVEGHPAVRELAYGGLDSNCRDCAAALLECSSLRALTKLRVTACEDEDGGDGGPAGMLGCVLFAALQLPPALRSLHVTFLKAGVRGEGLRLDELLAMLGCAVGGRLQSLSLVLKVVGPAEAESSRNPLLLLPGFPRLEALRLGCWGPESSTWREPADALALLGPLVQPLAAARALAPSLRAVELVLSDEWGWGPEQDEGVAGLARANPGLSIDHSCDPYDEY